MPETKKKTTKTKSEPPKPKLLEEEFYSLVLSREEVITAIQILSFSQTLFEQMATNSAKDGEDEQAKTWSARAKLNWLLYSKLRDVASIGEPDSKEVH